MRVYLCDLVHNAVQGANVLTGNLDVTVPLNAASIAAYSQRHVGDLELRVFKFPNEFLAAFEAAPADVVGFSTYAWNTNLNLQIIDYLKTHHPHVVAVMGGPSIRIDQKSIEEFLLKHPQVDAYVMYEGEGPFAAILKFVREHGPVLKKAGDSLGNVAQIVNGALCFTPAVGQMPLDDFPSPYLSGFLDEFIDRKLIALFETNRGCPFSCTFCAWGISALSKVKKFPDTYVRENFEYVARNAPDLPFWIIADANFGIHPRDIESAKMVAELRKSLPALHTILTWDSKNTPERNMEIAKILGRFDQKNNLTNTNKGYLAVQNLTEHVLENIKRDNIKQGNIGATVERYHDSGLKVTTDVLYALPGESFEDAIGSLRKAFDYGFDYVNFARTLMLPGSEMETEDSRKTFGLVSKYMLRRGSYGKYRTKFGAIKAIEYDEIIVAGSRMSEEESISLHMLQWLIFFGWNHGRLGPLLSYLKDAQGINPVDALLAILRGPHTGHPHLENFFAGLRADLNAAIFDSPEALWQHFAENDRHWEELMRYVRVELRSNARMYWDRRVQSDLFDYCADVFGAASDAAVRDLVALAREEIVDIASLAAGETLKEKVLRLESGVTLRLWKSEEQQQTISRYLTQHSYETDPINAVERLVGAHFPLLVYERQNPSRDPVMGMRTAG